MPNTTEMPTARRGNPGCPRCGRRMLQYARRTGRAWMIRYYRCDADGCDGTGKSSEKINT